MTRRVRIRSLIIGGFFTLFFIALIFRVYWIQVVEASWLLDKAEQSWEASEVLQPNRGTILDRNGNILAEDAPSFTVAVNPKLIHQYDLANPVVDGLAPLLEMDQGQAYNKLYGLVTKKKQDGSYYTNVEIRNEGWKIDADIAANIREWMDSQSIKGVYLLEEQKRYYPAGELAAHLLGYTNKEGEAIMGLESAYNDVLHGIPGKINYERDLLGYELPNSEVIYQPATDGKTIKLTIDQNIQHYLEQAMRKVNEKYTPKSMTAIAVDPQTMEILALANMPNFNPNKYWDFESHGDFYNHAIGSIYEPGSTFKIVTLAAAVEEGIFNPNDTYQSGSIKVPGGTFHDHNISGWGEITYLDGLKRSSNVAFVKLGYEGLGGEKLREYINKFGFGQRTGVDISGESSGSIGFKYDTEIATATFGQGKVTVTALQQAAAVAAIANGGKLMWPHVVKEVVDSETGEVIEEIKPKEIRQVISERTANKVSGYLEQVVSDQEIGTGRRAYIDGYRVAGKTGTANKVIDGKYAEDKWVVSFVGYAPVNDPKILVVVIVDEPNLEGDYRRGGDVASPIFKETVSQSLRYLGVPKDRKDLFLISSKQEMVTVPDLKDLSVGTARNEVAVRGFEYEILGDGTRAVAQYPQPGTEKWGSERIYIMTESIEHIQMPDLTNQSLRDALEICSILQVKCELSGEGYVQSQQWLDQDGEKKLQLTLAPLSEAIRADISEENGEEGTSDENLKSEGSSEESE
jgi:penicillin-binding protein 2B